MHTVPWDLEVLALNDYDDDDGYHYLHHFQCHHHHHHKSSPSKQPMHLLALWDFEVSALEGDFEKRTKEMVLQNLLWPIKEKGFPKYTRQYQIRVRFESRGVQFFKVLEKWFSMTKYVPIIILWCSEKGFYKKVTWSPVLGVLPMPQITWQRMCLFKGDEELFRKKS